MVQAAGKTRLTAYCLVAIGLAGLLLTPFLTWAPLAATVLLIASVSVLGLGIIVRLLLAVLLSGLVGALLMQFTTVLQWHPSFVGMQLAIMLAAFAYAYVWRRSVDLRTSVTDLTVALAGVAVFVAIALPLFGASTSKTLAYLGSGEDNNSHFQLYRYTLTSRQYAYNNTEEEAGIRLTLLSYAQGSHAAMSFVTAPFVEYASPAKQLKAYAFAAAATYALAVSLGLLLIIRGLQPIKRLDWKLALATTIGGIFTIGASTGILLSLYTYGFYPHYYSYLWLMVILLAVLPVRMYGTENGDKKVLLSKRRALAESSLLILGFYAVMASWYLLAPVAIVPVVLYICRYWRSISRVLKPLAVVLLPAVLAGAYLLYIYLFTSHDGSDHLLTSGGVTKLPAKVLLLALPAAAIAVQAWRRRQLPLLGACLAVLVSAGVAGFIGHYQQQKLGHYDYYFYKYLFTVLYASVTLYGYVMVTELAHALGLAGEGASVGQTVRGQCKRLFELVRSPVLWSVLGIWLVSAVLVATNLSPAMSRFKGNKYTLGQTGRHRALDVFTNESIFNTYSDVIGLNSCDIYRNFTVVIWAGGFFLPYDTQRADLEYILGQSPDRVRDQLRLYAANKSKPVAVMPGSVCGPGEGVSYPADYFDGLKNVVPVDVRGNPLRKT